VSAEFRTKTQSMYVVSKHKILPYLYQARQLPQGMGYHRLFPDFNEAKTNEQVRTLLVEMQ